MDSPRSNERRSKQQYYLPLTPLNEGPEYATMSCHHQAKVGPKERSWEAVLEWFKTRKNTETRPPSNSSSGGDNFPGGGKYHDADHNDNLKINSKKYRINNSRRRLLLRVLGCPLAPISLNLNSCSIDFHDNIKDIPIERSTAKYIIQQYLAATGCLKMMAGGAQQREYYRNMYTTGTVKMICCETEVSLIGGLNKSSSLRGSLKRNLGPNLGHGSRGNDSINGCFVLWQMVPRMWSLEMVLSSGNKVMAGSDGDIVWSYTPSFGTQIAKGPQRPLRRLIQGLDPKSTAALFAKAECLGERRIGEEECFVLKVCAGQEDVMTRNRGPGPGSVEVEVLRHVLYGYFSQKSGRLVYMEDSQLSRAVIEDNDTDSEFFDQKMEEVVYWETSIGSSIGDYREVDGLMVAHQGRSVATVFGFPEFSYDTKPFSVQDQQPYMYRTRFEEFWNIDDIAFNIPGLSSHSFLPPSR